MASSAGRGRVAGVHAAVGEDEDGRAAGDGRVRAPEEVVQRRGHARGAVGGGHEHGQRGRAEAPAAARAVAVQRAQAGQVAIREEGRGQADHAVAVVQPLVEQVALRAEQRIDRGHQLLADGVEGRVRDLREELLEVAVERLRALGEHGQGRVRAHGAERLLPLARHGAEVVLGVLHGVAEGHLRFDEGLAREGRRRFGGGQLGEAREVGVEPARVIVRVRQPPLQLLVADDAPPPRG